MPGQLPPEVRDERCREWAAELPAILHDPQVRFAPRRAARMLGYAADTLRGTAMTPGKTPGVIARSRLASLFLGIFLVGFAALNIWAIVRAPGDGQYYLRLVAGLLFAAYFSARVARWLLLACRMGTTCTCIADWLELVPGGGVLMTRGEGNRLPDLVESGWSGRRLAGNSRFLIASAFMALGAALVIAALGAVHYHAQANGLRRPLSSPPSPAAVAAAALPRVSSSAAALPADGPVRGKVAVVMVDHLPAGTLNC